MPYPRALILLITITSLVSVFALSVNGLEDIHYNNSVRFSYAIDQMSNHHFLHTDSGKLYYSEGDGTSWNTNQLDFGFDIFSCKSLDIDSEGRVHIIFNSAMGLCYYIIGDELRDYQVISNDGESNYEIKLDQNDAPHVGYISYTNYTLKYATFQGNWITYDIFSLTSDGVEMSMDLNSKGEPMIAVEERFGSYPYESDLYFAEWNGNGFDVANTGEPGGGRLKLRIGPDDEPRIVHSGDEGFTYTYRTTDGWVSKPQAGMGSYRNSFIIDNEGVNHVCSFSGSDVMYATGEDGNWDIQTIASGLDLYKTHVDIALDETTGDVYVAYNDADTNTIKFEKVEISGFISTPLLLVGIVAGVGIVIFLKKRK